MAIDFAQAEPGSPEWWLNYLLAQFDMPQRLSWTDYRYTHVETRRQRFDKLWAYNTGNAPLPTVADGYGEAFQAVMRKARCNYAPMCVNAMLDRMDLVAVSTGVDSTLNGDDTAAQIADASNLAAEIKDLFNYTFSLSEGYAMVVPPADSSSAEFPIIKALDPRNAVGEPDPNNPIALRAFLTRQWDPVFQQERVHLFLPGRKYIAKSDKSMTWEWVGGPEPVTGIDELGGVPAIRLDNRNGLGEFEPHLDLLDRINDTTLQRIVLTWYQSFRQRAVVGDLEGDDDETESGEDETDWGEIFRADPGALWRVPEGVTFWESNQADLTPILSSKRDDVKEFAAVTATPLHLITPDAANGSAEGASLMRESLNHKVLDRRSRFTPGLKLLWKMAFNFAKQPERGRNMALQWGPVVTHSLADKGSATSQARGVLSDERILVDVWGMSPQEAQQNMNERTAQQLLFGNDTTSAAPAAAG